MYSVHPASSKWCHPQHLKPTDSILRMATHSKQHHPPQPGIDLEYAWNRAKKTFLFLLGFHSEWPGIWVLIIIIFYLEWGGNLLGFLPNSYHFAHIHLECMGEGKVLLSYVKLFQVNSTNERYHLTNCIKLHFQETYNIHI